MLKAYVAAQARLANIKDRLSKFENDESGAALVEYALLVGLVAVAAIAGAKAVGTALNTGLQSISTHISSMS